MRNVIAFVVALGLVIAIFWLTRSKDEAPRRPVATAPGSAPVTPNKADPETVRRLDKPARDTLRAQIAEAREKARAAATAAAATASTSTTPPPALPDDTMKLEDVAAPLQEALKQTIPIVAECYADQPGLREALAQLVLTTDPELGTVIDTTEITGANGEPLAPKLDTCMRESLALPPLGARAGKLPLQYTFKFD
jgi:hypothetical protein